MITAFASEKAHGTRACQYPAIIGSVMIVLTNYCGCKSNFVVKLFTGMYAFSLLLYLAYANMDFSQLKDTGAYSVGFHEFHINGGKQAVSMYYPIAKFDQRIPAKFL